MTTQGFNQNIDIPHRCSRILIVFFLSVHLVVLTGVLAMELSWLVKASIFLVACVGAFLSWRQIQFLSSVSAICVREGGLELVMNCESVPVKIVGNSVVTEFFIAFSCRNTRSSGRFYEMLNHVVLLRDSVSPEHHRILRVLFKAGRLEDTSVDS